MAELMFSNVYNKQHFTLLWFVNNDDDNPFIQMQICFLMKIKIEYGQIYGQAYYSMVA